MSIRSLETAVLAELRSVANRHSIRLKDIMEWSTGEVKTEADETTFFLPSLRIYCSVKTASLGKKRVHV